MDRDSTKPRSHEHQIIIDAPVEAVWKALTDAEELTRWLCDKARVIPGEGGRMWSAWGESELQSDGKIIEVWEPGKRLTLVLDPKSQIMGPAATAAQSRLGSDESEPNTRALPNLNCCFTFQIPGFSGPPVGNSHH